MEMLTRVVVRWGRRVLCVGFLGVCMPLACAQSVAELQWVTEEYAPYNFTENGQLRGISVEVLQQMWDRLGVERTASDVQVLPWARGYRMAQEQQGVCLFSTTVTEARKQMFAFVEPIIETQVTIIAPIARGLNISAVYDLAPLTIGVVREDIGEQALLEEGVTASLSRADSARSLVRMLAGGRFDAISYEMNTVRWNMTLENIDANAYETVFIVRDGVLGIACHKDTDPATVGQLQEALDALIADGTVASIQARYLQ